MLVVLFEIRLRDEYWNLDKLPSFDLSREVLGLTVAVAKDRAVEPLMHTGDKFVLNILKEGMNLRRHFLKSFAPGSDRFAGLETQEAENGCPILSDALAYLECTVESRIECGDHWLVYAVVDNGKTLEPVGMTAVHQRKSGSHY